MQAGKKRKISDDKSGVVKKSPRSSTPVELENVPCSGAAQDVSVVGKEDKASASEASNVATGNSRQERFSDCVTDKLVSSEEDSSGEDCIMLEKSSGDLTSQGSADESDQKKADESLNISDPKNAEVSLTPGSTEDEENSSPPSSCLEVSICNEDEGAVRTVETTDCEASCRSASALLEEPVSQPQHDTSASGDDSPSTTISSECKGTPGKVTGSRTLPLVPQFASLCLVPPVFQAYALRELSGSSTCIEQFYF